MSRRPTLVRITPRLSGENRRRRLEAGSVRRGSWEPDKSRCTQPRIRADSPERLTSTLFWTGAEGEAAGLRSAIGRGTKRTLTHDLKRWTGEKK
ncbi:hypothetical protein PUN28_013089 [Cardiocondyla obscurior]|uniref:Uncharacterized protein n=1 Tax=Cardiocondyla obscurior TaxID=286306 RepID=A0AAW2FBZ0_9HYME